MLKTTNGGVPKEAAICVHMWSALPRVHPDSGAGGESTLHRHQVDRRILASSIDFDVELDPVTLVEFAHPRTLDRTDVHERVGLAVVAGNEAEALHRVEELDRAGRLFAGQRTLRRFFALFDHDHVADRREIGGGNLAATIYQVEFELLALGEAFEARALDRADVDEHVLTAAFLLNEAEAFVRVEELDHALAGSDDLRGHSAAAAAAASAEPAAAATVAAAEAAASTAATTEPVAATAAEAVTAATEPVAAAATARKRIETLFAETVPLVAATAATPSIETHKPERTFVSPQIEPPGHADESRQTTRPKPHPNRAGSSPAGWLITENRVQGESIQARSSAAAARCDISAELASARPDWQRGRMDIVALLTDPTAWAALITLIVLEVVLGIDNLVFIAILSNKLPPEQQTKARRIGLSLALIMRIGLLTLIGWIVTLQHTLFDLGIAGKAGSHGEPGFETAFSGRDLILIAGGLFLLWKATNEIHHSMDPEGDSGELLDRDKSVAQIAFGAAIVQIIALDIVFSIDSILTAVGMTDEVPIMIAAVVITVGLMMVAADPLAKFIEANPTLIMLALAFLVMIGIVLLADGFGVHIPKGYIYAAMGFSALVETLNIVSRNRRARARAQARKD